MTKELEHARDIKEYIKQTEDRTHWIGSGGQIASLCVDGLEFQPVIDAVTGKTIIRANGIKAITISEEGEITTGFTEEEPTKGYSYRLIQE